MCFSAFQSDYCVYIPRIFDFNHNILIRLSLAPSVLEMLRNRRKALFPCLSSSVRPARTSYRCQASPLCQPLCWQARHSSTVQLPGPRMASAPLHDTSDMCYIRQRGIPACPISLLSGMRLHPKDNSPLDCRRIGEDTCPSHQQVCLVLSFSDPDSKLAKVNHAKCMGV